MANKSVKKPQSLNDSHYRFLQDLSAPPKTSSKPLADENDTPIQPRNLIYQDVDDDTIPQFSAITDFDSSSHFISFQSSVIYVMLFDY
jgi:hypothetical protein